MCISEQDQKGLATEGWETIETTIGSEGNMNGVILQDEEYHDVCRVTLEQCISPPFVLTVEIYGAFLRFIFAEDLTVAKQKYTAVKRALAEFVKNYDDSTDFGRWCDDFVRRF